MLSRRKIRLACIEAATQESDTTVSPNIVINRARRYERWILGIDRAPADD